MPGPFVHKVSLKIVKDMLQPIMNNGLDLHIDIPLNPLYYLKPDREGGSHGADVKKDNYMIMDMIEDCYVNLRNQFIKFDEIGEFNNEEFQENVLYLNHYLCDSMTVNQISGNDFWGMKDNLIDVASEMVWNKKKYQTRPLLEHYKNYDDLYKLAKQRIIDTYTRYHDDALKWTSSWYRYVPFYLSRHVTEMIRRAVTYSAHTTALFVYKVYIDILGKE